MQKNNRIYWYKKTNGEIFDCDEFSASKIHNRFPFIGWSTGEFFLKLGKIQLTSKHKAPKGSKEKVEEIINQEIEFATKNEDRTPPRDFSMESLPSSADVDGTKAIQALRSRG